MTEVRVGTGFGSLLNQMGSGKADSTEIAQSAGFMISLQKASVSDVASRQQTYASAETDAETVVTAQNRKSETVDYAPQADTAANREYAQNPQIRTEENGKAQITDSEIKAAIEELTGGEVSESLIQQAKKFFENLKGNLDLQEKLKNLLVQSIHNAFQKLQNPEEQEEEFTLKVLSFLEKFVERLTEKDNEKSPLEKDEDGSAEGLLMQMLDNMIKQMQSELVKDTAAANAAALEVQAAVPVQAAENVDLYVNTGTGEIGAVSAVGEARETASAASIPTVQPNTDDTARETLSETKPTDVQRPITDGFEVPEEKTVLDSAAYEQIAEDVYGEVSQQFSIEVDSRKTEIIGEPVDSVALNRIRTAVAKESKSSAEELEELKRLFGLEPKKPKELEETEENEESEEEGAEKSGNGSSQGSRRSAPKPAAQENFSIKASEKLGVESVAVTEKAEAPAVARSFTLGEAGVKQVLSQVVAETLNNLPQEQGEKSFMMTLNPETLGRITVRMVENAGKMEIVVTAHNKDTADLLASRLDGMETMMKQSGTQLEKCQVVYEPEQNDRAGQQNYEGSSKNPYFRQQDETDTDEDGRFAEALRQQAV